MKTTFTCTICGVKLIRKKKVNTTHSAKSKLSDETKAKISKAMKGRTFSKEARRKISRGIIISNCAKRRKDELRYKNRNKRITRLILTGYTFTEIALLYEMYPTKVRLITMRTLRKLNVKGISHEHDCIMYYRINRKALLHALKKY